MRSEVYSPRMARWSEAHEIVKTIGTGATLAAVVALVLTIRHEIPRIRTEVLPGITRQLVAATHSEGNQTRAMISQIAGDLSKKIDDRAKDLQGEVAASIGKVEVDANDRAKDAIAVARDQMERLNGSIALFQESAGKVASLSTPIAGMISKLDDGVVVPLTNCENNPSCFENRWKGTSEDFEQLLRSISKSTPEMTAALEKNADNSAEVLANMGGITADVHEFINKFVHPKKKRWYQRFGDYFLATLKIVVYVL